MSTLYYVTVIALSLFSASSAACEKADLVLHNTTVYTANDSQWKAQAVASLGNKIVFVGSNEAAKKYMCGNANVIDMAGKTVFAGFTDSHQHLEGVGKRTKTLSLFGLHTLKRTVQEIENWASSIPENNWVLGRGWMVLPQISHYLCPVLTVCLRW
jgi:predicted amidohydrolase YtcJ